MKFNLICLLILSGLVLSACSAQKNTVVSKAFHNLASHYNGYFYADEEMTKVELSYFKSMTDDYNRILRLYPKLDSAQSKSYEKELQEVVKMASLAIQHHQNSKWVDDSYILVGKARHYGMDWGNAIQTFKYVNTSSKDKDARHKAILNLMRTFTEHQEFTNAKAAGDFLQKEKLNSENQKQLFLERAYLAQTQNDLNEMVYNLTQASPLLRKKSDRPGRVYFIVGQVYQKLGFEAEAYNYYRKCLSTHPEYEVDFYARLYMAQVTQISKSKNINSARKSFKKLLKDKKNKDFKDKIFYEMGVFENKQKNTTIAIENYNQAIRIGNNKRVDGEAYLRLGELYYENKKYEFSKAYYDSAVSTLPSDYENLVIIKKRQQILDEFVKHINTIRWQDSLLTLADLDTAALRLHVEKIVKANLKKEEDTKKKKRNRINIEQVQPSIFETTAGEETESGSTWYFANPAALSLGQSEFERIWGNIALEDNWRRSQKTSTRQQNTTALNTGSSGSSDNPQASEKKTDPVAAAIKDIKAELPNTDEKREEAYKKIEDAYFSLGDIYSLQLLENENAIETYQTLLKRFPSSKYEAEVLYRLYILTKEKDTNSAQQYASQLKSKHPESSWYKLLVNPNYLAEAGKVAVRQKALYAIAYSQYVNHQYDSASIVLNNAQALGTTNFTPNLTLLQILLIGKTQNATTYKDALKNFIQQNAEHELSSYAKKLLESAEQLVIKTDTIKNLFNESREGEHFFIILFSPDPTLEKTLNTALTAFNKSNFPEQSFAIENVKVTDEKTICIVSQFSDSSSALNYIGLFNEKLSSMNSLKTYNFNNFVITKENLETLKRTQALNEYLVFYKQQYQTENQ